MEHGTWTPIPRDPPDDAHLIKLKDIDPDASHLVKKSGIMSFHAAGCSGNYSNHVPGLEIAKAMAMQVADSRVGGGSQSAAEASFLFHLGDVVYKDEDPSDPNAKDQSMMYNSQFYAQYTSYQRQIFAIPGARRILRSAEILIWVLYRDDRRRPVFCCRLGILSSRRFMRAANSLMSCSRRTLTIIRELLIPTPEAGK